MIVCNKQKYDKKTAQTILNERQKNKRKFAKEIRIYECNICKDCWHLTSRLEYNEKVYIPIEELIYKNEWIKLKKESD